MCFVWAFCGGLRGIVLSCDVVVELIEGECFVDCDFGCLLSFVGVCDGFFMLEELQEGDDGC